MNIENFELASIEDRIEVNVAIDSIGLNSASLSLIGDSNGIVYWYLGCEGTTYTYEDLVSDI